MLKRSCAVVLFLLAGTGIASALVATLGAPPGATTVPGGIVADAAGNLYTADFGGAELYRLSPEGQFTLVATGLKTPSGNAIDSQGNIFQSNYADQANQAAPDTITRIAPNGAVSTFASGLNGPVGIAIDGNDELWVAMCNQNSVWTINGTGTARPVAAGPLFNCPNGITFDDVGDLYVANFSNGNVVRVQPDATTSLLAVLPGGGNGHLVYVAGDLYVADRNGHRIYRVSVPDGVVTPFAGSGIAGLADGNNGTAQMNLPNGIARNAAGDTVYVNEFGGFVRAIALDLPKPGKPDQVKARPRSSTTVLVQWRDRDRREEGFRVETRLGKGAFTTAATVPWNTTSVLIDGLAPRTQYQVRVVAFNGTRERPSKKVRVRTRR